MIFFIKLKGTTKLCNKCNQDLEVSLFSIRKDGKTLGLKSQCKHVLIVKNITQVIEINKV